MILQGKILCILFAGKAGVGKTTSKDILKDILERNNHVVYTDSFACGVKEAAKVMGWDGKKDSRGRSLLQKVGQLGRWYDSNTWVRQLFERYWNYPKNTVFPAEIIIVDDWRFPNELLFVQNEPTKLIKPITIRIEAPNREILKGTPEYSEESETSLPSAPSDIYNYVIDNSRSMESLETNLYDLYKILGEKKDESNQVRMLRGKN